MLFVAPALCAALLVVAPAGGAGPGPAAQDAAEIAAEPQGGIGVSPIELVPRLELRQTFTKLASGVAVHDTILETDIEFLRRVLLRYQLPARLMETPSGQLAGIGDLQIGLVAILWSTPRLVVGALGGVQLDTATQPPLGTGKPEVIVGGAVAVKPYRWWLAYGLAQQELSVRGDPERPDVNQLTGDFGSILFGKRFNWLKLDVTTTADFAGATGGRVYGTLEGGSLVAGRVGLFMRTGTQLVGPRLIDYSVTAGVRYLFRLEVAKPAPVSRAAP